MLGFTTESQHAAHHTLKNMQWNWSNFLSWIFWFCALSCLLADWPAAPCNQLMQYFINPIFRRFLVCAFCSTSALSGETFICLLLGYKLPNCSSIVWVLTCHFCKSLLTPALIATVESTALGKYCLPSSYSLFVLHLHSLYHPALPYVMACKRDHKEVRSTCCQ